MKEFYNNDFEKNEMEEIEIEMEGIGGWFEMKIQY